MIKNDKTIDGISISSLSLNSHKRVIKICDNCKKEVETSVREINKSRKRSKTGLDLCFPCAIRYAGKARRKGSVLIGDGYLSYYEEGVPQRQFLHRKVIEDNIGRKLLKTEVVHHIDGDKLNNKLTNLLLCENSSVHKNIHSLLQEVAFKLVKSNIIKFDFKTKAYYVSNLENYLDMSLGFESIAIKQKKNICKSRNDVNTESEIIKDIKVKSPLIPSNMSTVINSDFYIKTHKLGAFAFLHRALSEERYLFEVDKVSKECSNVAVSIGTGNDQYELAKKLINNNANIVLIDIAHGYSDEVIELGKKLKKEYPHIKIVLGNTTNIDMLYEVSDFCDALKLGLSQGFACETANTAGCTEKQFSAVLKFKEEAKRLGMPLISDGAIREPADFVKAVGAGANSIMAGKIFAMCPESAAEIVNINGISKKLYAGMASRHVQEKWKGQLKPGTCPEGRVRYLDIGESLENLLERYTGALKSGITYAGGKDIETFQKNVEFIKLV